MISQVRTISPREQAAVDEFEQRLRSVYPEARFEVKVGGEPDGVYLMATTNEDDTFEVLDHIMDLILRVQIDEGLPVYVIPLPPEEPS